MLGVYVHYPYCAKRCPYCDFNVVQPGPEGRPDDRYGEAVLAELAVRAPDYAGHPPAVSLYFGGGTPALWAPRWIGRVVEAVRASLGLVDGAEITIEANPGELTAEAMVALRAVGVNRLSLGTQSFDAALLTRLGRRNTPADNRRCVAQARAAGFENLSLDLIQAVAGQSVAGAMADVAAVIELEPEHVSTYELTIHPQTPFGARAQRGEVLTADEDVQVEVYERTRDALGIAGILPYEISNAARPGREAVHNSLYWNMDEYVALGAGAHGFRWVPDAEGGVQTQPGGVPTGIRWENERHAGRYMKAALAGTPAHRQLESIDAETLRCERVMTGLRVDRGLAIDAELESAYGQAAQKLEGQGLLDRSTPGRWRLTSRGRLVLNQVVATLTA